MDMHVARGVLIWLCGVLVRVFCDLRVWVLCCGVVAVLIRL